ncbi:MAG: hypothetical protein LBS62_09985 [Clostridiales bacterium]|jgi:hypothetical protein|nr:hypothetical protein [Clostridiales bacterium]
MKATYDRARAFLYRNARPLDIARFQYHFEGGSREAALTALAAYQNGDGGFGHALEADAWNPNSAPIQTWAATEILREIGAEDAKHPIIQGMLRYLASGAEFDGRFWYNAPRSNNDFPHAPWWHIENNTAHNGDYNPTAALAAFILRFAKRDSDVYALGERVANEALEQLFSGKRENDMHTVLCYIRLWEAAQNEELLAKLRGLVKSTITPNTAKSGTSGEWGTSYICRPSRFFNSRGSVFYADNKNIADYEWGYIVKSQLKDGSWNIPWNWAGAYPEEWAVSKNWWKGNGAVLNLLYLRGMSKI